MAARLPDAPPPYTHSQESSPQPQYSYDQDVPPIYTPMPAAPGRPSSATNISFSSTQTQHHNGSSGSRGMFVISPSQQQRPGSIMPAPRPPAVPRQQRITHTTRGRSNGTTLYRAVRSTDNPQELRIIRLCTACMQGEVVNKTDPCQIVCFVLLLIVFLPLGICIMGSLLRPRPTCLSCGAKF